ncbi:hypothetical protein VKT23_014423 [Stygiomarasmius scandens]|uniref:Uncharacterized protein n=1 Tax=Marasmiellus scandens TaxID=2682957 RepID=A0ABR1J358_9AGAR
MFVPYTEQDKQLYPDSKVHWLYDRIAGYYRQRPPISNASRQMVIDYKDEAKTTMIKHHVPWIRISRQLAEHLCKGDNGRGMTRAASIKYIDRVMETLKMDDETQETLKKPLNIDPEHDRHSYDLWISWAVDAICDWPKNMFQGDSTGDGGGRKVDRPNVGTALQDRLREAREALGDPKGLKLNTDTNAIDEPPFGIDDYNDDDWFMPYYSV